MGRRCFAFYLRDRWVSDVLGWKRVWEAATVVLGASPGMVPWGRRVPAWEAQLPPAAVWRRACQVWSDLHAGVRPPSPRSAGQEQAPRSRERCTCRLSSAHPSPLRPSHAAVFSCPSRAAAAEPLPSSGEAAGKGRRAPETRHQVKFDPRWSFRNLPRPRPCCRRLSAAALQTSPTAGCGSLARVTGGHGQRRVSAGGHPCTSSPAPLPHPCRHSHTPARHARFA